MDLEVQAEAVETGRQELALWLAKHGILDVHVFLSKVRACLGVADLFQLGCGKLTDLKLLGTDEYTELKELGASAFLLKRLQAAITAGAALAYRLCSELLQAFIYTWAARSWM
jgi:hypothetical protein